MNSMEKIRAGLHAVADGLADALEEMQITAMKAAAMPDTAAPSIVAPESKPVADSEPGGIVSSEDAEPTIEEIKAGLEAICIKKTRQQAIDILKAHGAKNLPTLDKALYGAVLADIKKVLEG